MQLETMIDKLLIVQETTEKLSSFKIMSGKIEGIENFTGVSNPLLKLCETKSYSDQFYANVCSEVVQKTCAKSCSCTTSDLKFVNIYYYPTRNKWILWYNMCLMCCMNRCPIKLNEISYRGKVFEWSYYNATITKFFQKCAELIQADRRIDLVDNH
jgi:hypothetical protein